MCSSTETGTRSHLALRHGAFPAKQNPSPQIRATRAPQSFSTPTSLQTLQDSDLSSFSDLGRIGTRQDSGQRSPADLPAPRSLHSGKQVPQWPRLLPRAGAHLGGLAAGNLGRLRLSPLSLPLPPTVPTLQAPLPQRTLPA